MASILKVDSMQGVTSAGDITITGEGTATMRLQQGVAKAWHDANAAHSSLEDSFNLSGLTDNGTGDFHFSFTNNMNSANFATSTVTSHAEISGINHGQHSTSQYNARVWSRADSLSYADNVTQGIVMGDLA